MSFHNIFFFFKVIFLSSFLFFATTKNLDFERFGLNRTLNNMSYRFLKRGKSAILIMLFLIMSLQLLIEKKKF